MSTWESPSAAPEYTSANATFGSDVHRIGVNLPASARRAPLLEPNRDDPDQTRLDHGNGSSSALHVSPRQPVVSMRAMPETRECFQAMQKWEGYVTEVSQDTFRATLVRIVGEGPDQEAEVYTEDVEPADRAMIEPGAVFYWSIGYLDRPSGRIRASIIRFRRLPAWTRRELQSADAEADRLKGLFYVDQPS